jgi:hypothetical protein
LELSSYNGWENKFTWLVHLHLSNEQDLMNEITELVADELHLPVIGQRVERWVKGALTRWLICFSERATWYDESLRLFAWDLVGSALAYADWESLVAFVIGQATTSENVFTMTLYRSILGTEPFQWQVSTCVREASSRYACADALKEWFRSEIDTWMDTPPAHRQGNAPIAALIISLIQDTYSLVCWEHVAEAFRADY